MYSFRGGALNTLSDYTAGGAYSPTWRTVWPLLQPRISSSLQISSYQPTVIHWDTLWHTGLHRDTQWHEVTHRNTQWHTGTHSDTFGHTVTHCGTGTHRDNSDTQGQQWHTGKHSDKRWHTGKHSDIQGHTMTHRDTLGDTVKQGHTSQSWGCSECPEGNREQFTQLVLLVLNFSFCYLQIMTLKKFQNF